MYQYSGLDKVTNILEDNKVISSYNYSISGQLASATTDGATENFLWDGLALIRRGDTDYTNEPYVTGGNPVVAGDKVLFNDILGNTVGIKSEDKLKLIQMTAFGETADKDAFFTGKPAVNNLGYSFLFRNYRADQGKWQTSDPLGFPDGWNNLAYCNSRVTNAIDWLGGVTINSFPDALNHYAYGEGASATIGEAIILQFAQTNACNSAVDAVNALLANVPISESSGTVSYSDSIFWNQGNILGGNYMAFYTSVGWSASDWTLDGDRYVRTVSGMGDVLLSTTDRWDFEWNDDYSFWNNLFAEFGAGTIADAYSYLIAGNRGESYNLSGSARIRSVTFSAKQYE